MYNFYIISFLYFSFFKLKFKFLQTETVFMSLFTQNPFKNGIYTNASAEKIYIEQEKFRIYFNIFKCCIIIPFISNVKRYGSQNVSHSIIFMFFPVLSTSNFNKISKKYRRLQYFFAINYHKCYHLWNIHLKSSLNTIRSRLKY